MLISKEVEITWQRSTLKYYKSKGYVYTGINDKFIVKVEDLPKGSHAKVHTSCDNCGNKSEKVYKAYMLQTKNGTDMELCIKCKNIKLERNFIENYGVANPMQVDEFKNKQKESLRKNYGVESPLHSVLILEKSRQTNLERYGFDHPSKNVKVMDKVRKTNLEKYGVEHFSMTSYFNKKVMSTVQERYGVDFISQVPEVKQKKNETMYGNGTTMKSKQQVYIHDLVGGELNFPAGRSALDIAFPLEKIYVEYDGGGHNLKVKLGQLTQEEFDKSEKRRTFSLFDKGWREIRLVTDKDKLPEDFEILRTIEKSKSFLISGITKSIIINWDNRTVLFAFKKEFKLDEFLQEDFSFEWEAAL